METKNDLRKKILSKRNNINENTAMNKSEIVIDKLINTVEYQKSSIVFIYMSFKNEVDTIKLVSRMLSEGKQVVIPYTDKKNIRLIPCEIYSIDDLKMSPYGYFEPKEENIIYVKPEKFDLIIVPGVAFDKKFNRIGFGKGYYDRILCQKRKDAKAVALAYDFQVLDQIPYEAHDIKMDMIITETFIIKNDNR